MMYRADEKRYELMEYRRCGRSGLLLPLISLGLWHNFGEKADLSTMKKMIFTAFDNGITHFDLANNYGPGPGSAEINFGKILKEEMSSYRDEMIISTKAGYLMWPGPYGDMGSRKYLIASIDQSLKRLDLEYVDIFYHHRMDPDTPLEEIMGALEQIVRSGKALYAGLSNYDGPTLERAVKILEDRNVPFVIAQNCYNILNRTVEENGLKDAVKKNGKGLICYSPLAQGMLTDRYLNGIPSDSRVRTDGRFLKEEQVSGENLERIRELNSIAQQRGQTLAEMALAWLLSDDAVTSVIVGASRPEQIETNLKAIRNITFSHDELERIDILSQ
ncbi:MAG: L-glyceraldehyde 3-phosphate reductase [Clostridiales bacterium]|nr:L-glyceraldehyde 3-phosphate reductase [Clostridiales bacterium]